MKILKIFNIFIVCIASFSSSYCAYSLKVDNPLILTPLIKSGDYIKAQHLSKVSPNIGNVTSYSGFLTVNEVCESNLFFWFFPVQNDSWKEAPLILWLQGGPGWSSMMGVFEEIGPFEVKGGKLIDRPYAWNVENNVLAIDQPAGTGFSFSRKECYVQNSTAAAIELYDGLMQFFELFPDLKNNKFVIAGESYAGHYIPALGQVIHRNNPSSKIKINLIAMMIGNGWLDATYQIKFADYLYYLGLIDDSAREIYKYHQGKFIEQVLAEDWVAALKTETFIEDELYDKFVGKQVSMYNYVSLNTPEEEWQEYLNQSDVRGALHVGNEFFMGKRNAQAHDALMNDTLQSVRPFLEELLEFYPIIFYHGQLDIVCAYPMAISFLRSLSWSGQTDYLHASRHKWCVDKDLAGYFKGAKNLHEMLVRCAGHSVPADQSLWAYRLVNSITSGSPENPFHGLSLCPEVELDEL